MRSQGFAWLLQQCGFKPRILAGGYKAFRRAAHRCFAETRRVIILGGHSGNGKTRLLNVLRDEGEQVIDLEHLAGHRGSVFGGIGRPPQPTVEQFENDLFLQWRQLDPVRPVWMEGESRSIGKVFLPQGVWTQMSAAPAIHVELARDRRVEFLLTEYGDLPADELALAIRRISKRLGGANLKAALEALQRKDLHAFTNIALEYYDKAYSRSLQKRPRHLVRMVPLLSPGQPVSVKTLRQLGNDLTAPAETAPLTASPDHS
jgi:tRNA 2-selenouridine synthase